MVYQDWIATQTIPEQYDPATMEMLNSWFQNRVIFDEDEMETRFWMRMSIYYQPYLNMARIQEANETFDPLVSRYMEAYQVTSGQQINNGGRTVNRTMMGQNHNKRIWSSSDHINVNTTRDAKPVTDKRTKSFDDRTRESTRNGKRKLRTHGDADKNFTRDGKESKEVTYHKIDTTASETKQGTHITEHDNLSASKGTRADKAAPMTALNLQRQQATGQGNAIMVANGALGAQDWTSASAYSEESGESGDTGITKEYYQGDKSEIRKLGDKVNNIDQTDFKRNQQSGVDMEDEETFEDYGEKVTDDGSEIDTDELGERHEETKETREETHSPVTDSGTNSQHGQDIEENRGYQENQGENWNRYTGRDGLTPQAGFEAALKYLQSFPPCILWLFEQMDHCFIGALEV